MYARVTTYQIDPEHKDEVNKVLSQLKWKIKSLPGILSSHTVWNEDGRGVSMSIYDCKASAIEAATQLNLIWASFSNILAEKPVIEVFENTEDLLN